MQYDPIYATIKAGTSRANSSRKSRRPSPLLEMPKSATHPASGGLHHFRKSHSLNMRTLANLFGTPQRVPMGHGAEESLSLREIGKLLLQSRTYPPKG